MQTCPKCKRQNDDKAHICPECGEEQLHLLGFGTMLQNRYRISDLLGYGGFGAVYKADDLRLNIIIAVKENLQPSAQTAFLAEARLLAMLKHPNLPRVTDHFVENERQYLVMEYVDGESLWKMVNFKGRLSHQEMLALFEDIFDAVAYLHSQKPPIIHRDIKPPNIIVRSDGKAVLVDFGIAKVGGAGHKTQTWARGVTPGFAAPEQYAGSGQTDERTDIYALGATIYFCLTGLVPPEAPAIAAGTATLPLLHQINPSVPDTMSKAIAKAMAIEKTQRFATVKEFWRVLTAPLPSVTPSVQPTVPPPKQPSQPAIKTTSTPTTPSKRPLGMTGSADAFLRAGDAYWQQGKVMDAVRTWESGLRVDPTDQRLHAKLIPAYCQVGNIQKVLEHLKALPGTEQHFMQVGDFFEKRGQFDRALTVYREGLALYPDSAQLQALADACQQRLPGPTHQPTGVVRWNEWYAKAWELVKRDMFAHWMVGVLMAALFLLSSLMSVLTCFIPLVYFLTIGPLFGGLLVYVGKVILGKPASPADLFLGFRRFIATVGLMVLWSLPPALFFTASVVVPIMSALEFLHPPEQVQRVAEMVAGLTTFVLCCLSPVFYALYPIVMGTLMIFSFPLVMFRGLGAWGAFRQSFYYALRYFGSLLLFWIVADLLTLAVNAIGTTACVLPVLVTAPLTIIWLATAMMIGYREIVGLSEDELAPYL